MQTSSAKYATALSLEPRSSRRFALLLAATHGGAAAVVIAAGLAWWIDVLLCALIAASAAHIYLRHVSLSHARAVVRLVWTRHGHWRLVTADGAAHNAELQGDSYVHPWLVILNFTLQPGGGTSVVLFPDSLHDDDFRRLRVRLRTAA